MLFYFAHPEYVKGFVLYATGPGFTKDEGRLGWNRQAEKLAKGFEEKGLAALVGSDTRMGHRSAQGLANAARGNFAQRPDDEFFLQLSDGPLHCARHLNDIRAPARIIVGLRDKGFLKACEMLAAKLPGAEITRLAEAGHMCCETKADAFNQALLHYLDELVTPVSRL